VVRNRSSIELIPTTIRHVGGSGLCFLLRATPEKVSGLKLLAVGTRDSYGHVSVLVVDDVPYSVLAERVADFLAIDASDFPRYESPGTNERIRLSSALLQVEL
jgi:hypothetical protein